MATGVKARTAKNSRKLPTQVPTGLWETFAPPEDFDDVALCEFARLKSALKGIGTLDRTDPRLVSTAAGHYSLIARAKAELGGSTLTIVTPNGISMPHPLLKVIASYSAALRGLLNDMGLSPKTSAKAGATPEPETGTGWEGILNVVS